jgi:hypothetical protein
VSGAPTEVERLLTAVRGVTEGGARSPLPLAGARGIPGGGLRVLLRPRQCEGLGEPPGTCPPLEGGRCPDADADGGLLSALA